MEYLEEKARLSSIPAAVRHILEAVRRGDAEAFADHMESVFAEIYEQTRGLLARMGVDG